MSDSADPVAMAEARRAEVAQQVGWVALNAASLEYSATTLYTALLDSDVGSVITSGQSWRVLESGL